MAKSKKRNEKKEAEPKVKKFKKIKGLRLDQAKSDDMNTHIGLDALLFNYKHGKRSNKMLDIPIKQDTASPRFCFGLGKARAIVEYIEENSGRTAVLSIVPPQVYTGKAVIEPW